MVLFCCILCAPVIAFVADPPPGVRMTSLALPAEPDSSFNGVVTPPPPVVVEDLIGVDVDNGYMATGDAFLRAAATDRRDDAPNGDDMTWPAPWPIAAAAVAADADRAADSMRGPGLTLLGTGDLYGE